MKKLKTIIIRGDDKREYEISLTLNEAAIINKNLEVEIEGRYINQTGEQERETFLVRLVPSEEQIHILFHNEILGRINLRDIELPLEEEFDELDAHSAWEELEKHIIYTGKNLEHIINVIPAIDPIFGCLIKSGLSTVIGQLINCYIDARKLASKQRIWEVLRCLGINSYVMISKFTLRTFKCTLSGGWDIFF